VDPLDDDGNRVEGASVELDRDFRTVPADAP
jgi:hypothetical protein